MSSPKQPQTKNSLRRRQQAIRWKEVLNEQMEVLSFSSSPGIIQLSLEFKFLDGVITIRRLSALKKSARTSRLFDSLGERRLPPEKSMLL
jgi:hypothetical protein